MLRSGFLMQSRSEKSACRKKDLEKSLIHEEANIEQETTVLYYLTQKEIIKEKEASFILICSSLVEKQQRIKLQWPNLYYGLWHKSTEACSATVQEKKMNVSYYFACESLIWLHIWSDLQFLFIASLAIIKYQDTTRSYKVSSKGLEKQPNLNT